MTDSVESINHFYKVYNKVEDLNIELSNLKSNFISNEKTNILSKTTVINGDLIPLENTYNLGNSLKPFKSIYASHLSFNNYLELGNNANLFLNKIGRVGVNTNLLNSTFSVNGLDNFIIENVFLNFNDNSATFDTEASDIRQFIGKYEYFMIYSIDKVKSIDGYTEMNSSYLMENICEFYKIEEVTGKKIFFSGNIKQLFKDEALILTCKLEFLVNLVSINDCKGNNVLRIDYFGDIYYRNNQLKLGKEEWIEDLKEFIFNGNIVIPPYNLYEDTIYHCIRGKIIFDRINRNWILLEQGEKKEKNNLKFGDGLYEDDGILGININPNHLCISDNRIGISKNIMKKIFEEVKQDAITTEFSEIKIVSKKENNIEYKIETIFSNDNDEFVKDTSVKYWISTLSENGDQTKPIQTKEFEYSRNASSICFKINFDKKDEYRIYREVKFGSKIIYNMLEIENNTLMDILIPASFNKLRWTEIDEVIMDDQTYCTITDLKKNGEILISNSLKVNSIINEGIIINKDCDKNSLIINNQTNNSSLIELNSKKSENKIIGNDAYGSSELSIGGNISITNKELENIVMIGYNKSINMNDILGSYKYRLQVDNGGIVAEGDISTTYPKRFETIGNPVNNMNGAVLNTESRLSRYDGLTFKWDRNNLMAVPITSQNKVDESNIIQVKNFCIQHPIEENKYLIHNCLEGPTADIYYRKNVKMGKHEKDIFVELPEYFLAMVDLEEITVSLTSKIIFELLSWNNENKGIRIFRAGNPNYEVVISIMIIGKRKDIDIEVEPIKTRYNVNQWGPYAFVQDNISTKNLI